MLTELLIIAAAAASPADRVEELKQWKAKCSDADVDVRMAYVEAAIASEDATVARVCTRLAIENDNADVRNLGLRAAIALTDQVTFAVSPPAAYAAALEAAGDDESAVDAVKDEFKQSTRYWTTLRGGIPFTVKKSSVADPTSQWFATVGNGREDAAQGAAVVGDTVSWSGRVSNTQCVLTTKLDEEARLVGTVACANDLPYPVAARIF